MNYLPEKAQLDFVRHRMRLKSFPPFENDEYQYRLSHNSA